MKFPWYKPQQGGSLLAALNELIAVQKQRIGDLEQQNIELKALFGKTSNFEVVEQGTDGVKLKMKAATPMVTGRGGWRGKQASAEAKTIPQPADSLAALERRVVESGGSN